MESRPLKIIKLHEGLRPRLCGQAFTRALSCKQIPLLISLTNVCCQYIFLIILCQRSCFEWFISIYDSPTRLNRRQSYISDRFDLFCRRTAIYFIAVLLSHLSWPRHEIVATPNVTDIWMGFQHNSDLTAFSPQKSRFFWGEVAVHVVFLLVFFQMSVLSYVM